MATKNDKAMVAKPADNPNELQVREVAGKSRSRLLAEVGMEGLAPNARIADSFLVPMGLGESGITDCVNVLREHVADVKRGDLSYAESLLVSQAAALNSLFAGLVTRASMNLGQHIGAAEIYMRLALKAQSQCRCTLEALAEIKNPKNVAFVRQANIANGPQQINNGADPGARGKDSQPNEILEIVDGQWVDTGAKAKASAGNPDMETVAAHNRPKERTRKRAVEP